MPNIGIQMFMALGGQFVDAGRVVIQQAEELQKGLRGFGLAQFVTGKGVSSASEERSGLFLVESEFFAHGKNEGRIVEFGVDGTLKGIHEPVQHGAFRLGKHDFTAGRALVAFKLKRGGTAFIGVRHGMDAVDKFLSAGRAQHVPTP